MATNVPQCGPVNRVGLQAYLKADGTKTGRYLQESSGNIFEAMPKEKQGWFRKSYAQVDDAGKFIKNADGATNIIKRNRWGRIGGAVAAVAGLAWLGSSFFGSRQPEAATQAYSPAQATYY